LIDLPATGVFIVDDRGVQQVLRGTRWSLRADAGHRRLGYDWGFSACRQQALREPGRHQLLALGHGYRPRPGPV
jgi:hypothetical protein